VNAGTKPNPGSSASPGPSSGVNGSTTPSGPALDVKAILAKVGPSVVDVVAQGRDGMGDGSGIVISADGYILTNAHVVADATRITVTTRTGSKALPARLLGADEDRDVALLQIDGGAASSEGADGGGFAPAELGRSADLKVGDDVVAIGNALGLRGDPTVTRGIVSALNRTFDDLTGMIQTDAAINPGNSGGPLVNMFGQVIGINTAGAGEEGQNINFAIPIDAAQAIAERLKSGQGPAPVAFLGVSTTEPTDGGPGATIMEVVPDGPAAQAGLAVRDRIVTFDGKPVESADALSGIILDRQPGDAVDVVVERNGSSRTIKVRLGTRPPRP
jgi:putative serine protease PepD